MNPKYPAVAQRAGHRCEYCQAPEVLFNFPFEVEHITPSSLEGNDAANNLALSCRACNLFKPDYVTGVDDSNGQEIELFNPRHQTWQDHFRYDPLTGEIKGCSPSGRATVSRL